MPEPGRKKPSGTEAAKTQKPSQGPHSIPGMPTGPDQPPAAADAGPPVQPIAASKKREHQADTPPVLQRDGVAYLEGCDVPIWRLEMARRAGSGPQALIAAATGLTPLGLDVALAYARRHRAEFDPLIRRHSGADVAAEDDEESAAFEAELEALLETDAEVFRRLAQ